ncbi:MAG: hypothetical protein P8181_15350, partial [bacterium]
MNARALAVFLVLTVGGSPGKAVAQDRPVGSIIGWGSRVVVEQSALDNLVTIAAGSYHSLGVNSDGAVVAWGNSSPFSQCNVPAPNTGFVAIAAGWRYGLGLKTSGTIVAWGWNFFDQCDVPEPNENFVAVAGCYTHSLALRRSPSTCAVPEIVQVVPAAVNIGNCSGGCAVTFTVSTEDDYSQVQKITLERKLPGVWVEEDAIVAPIGDPDWTLTCVIDEHYTDGPNTYRAAFHCQDESKDFSFSVFVASERGVPVLITGFDPDYSDEGVTLRWTISDTAPLQGFNIYRSLEEETGFQRINEGLVPSDGENEYTDSDVVTGETYWYRLGAVADDGEWMSQTVSIAVPARSLVLHQN